ncbi:hypothetical protein VCHA38P217_220059 [Vibrio chagasii]|nr:hypothetical protein VCHA34P120_270061 [Vibrio chagasii]CAH7112317.1 hypothetical protein VCHA41O249_230002 [Vibrio chagasii]CAH7132377.1 hypothetical protein VCHA41O246_230001 [Vibrio chagasii]CAH7186489.1 hypothetical protein VCHA37P193_330062 [Vibrio chagasii]CAH7307094.1 hypothetical protein VCHA38P217_220059 [Vibrio chagasii]
MFQIEESPLFLAKLLNKNRNDYLVRERRALVKEQIVEPHKARDSTRKTRPSDKLWSVGSVLGCGQIFCLLYRLKSDHSDSNTIKPKQLYLGLA